MFSSSVSRTTKDTQQNRERNTMKNTLLVTTTTLLTLSGCASAPQKQDAAPQTLPTYAAVQSPAEAKEVARVHDVIDQLFAGVDGHQWDKVRATMSAHVQVNYAELGGPDGVIPTVDLVAGWEGFLPRFDRTVHHTYELSVDVVGDRATATFSGIALHTLEVDGVTESWTVLAGYDTEFVRVDGAWKLARIDVSLRDQAGNTDLPGIAASTPPRGANPASTAQPVVELFFQALESNDAGSLSELLAPDVVLEAPLLVKSSNKTASQLAGSGVLVGSNTDTTQRYKRSYSPTRDPNVVAVSFASDVSLARGRRYQNHHVSLFTVDNEGQIVRIEEHADPILLAQQWSELDAHHSIHASGASKADVTARHVTFSSGQNTLVGRIFVPSDFDTSRSYDAILVTGSWTSVKEQMPDVYASRLAARGFITMTFDFSGFGESQGEPRQLESPALKIRDIRAAMDFLGQQPGVNTGSISGLGICASAGYMAHAVAEDPRFANLLLVAPWLHDEAIARSIYDMRPGGSDGLIAASRAAAARYTETSEMDYVLAASELDPSSAMYVPNNAFDYYLNPMLGAGTHYPNRFAVASWEPWITFDGISAAKQIKQPVHIVHSKKGAIPNGTEQFYSKLGDSKTIAWLDDFSQLDFYHEPDAVSAALDVIVDHLK